MSDKKEWKYDSEYISYVESGESAAVFVVRDIVNAIETRGKWIDVVFLDTYYVGDRVAFNWIIVELFPRKIKPVYPKLSSDEEKKYITWQTANEDITTQRENGVRGPMFLVLCDLKQGEGKNITYKAVWNKTFGRWVPKKWFTSSCEYRERTKYIEGEWKYVIRAVKKVNQNQVDYIEKNRESILKKIGKNKPKLEFFGLEPSRKKTEAKKTTDKRR